MTDPYSALEHLKVWFAPLPVPTSLNLSFICFVVVVKKNRYEFVLLASYCIFCCTVLNFP